MKRLLTAVALLSLVSGSASASGSIVAPEYRAGVEIPMIEIVDDRGTTRSLESFKGAPMILAPIFTSCPAACPTIARNLIAAAAKSDQSLATYRVLFLSFDADDDVATLRRFRERQGVPLPWTIARAEPQDVRRLLDAVGYSYRKVGNHFAHPNMVIAFTPELKTAKYMMGTTYDLDEALRLARGGKDWVQRYGALTLSMLLLLCISSLVYLVVLIIR
jgi:cytochrome oxidase Cu insertion factor (SCO1/SenC/PrrC family)